MLGKHKGVGIEVISRYQQAGALSCLVRDIVVRMSSDCRDPHEREYRSANLIGLIPVAIEA
jgi:hypothetical protein